MIVGSSPMISGASCSVMSLASTAGELSTRPKYVVLTPLTPSSVSIRTRVCPLRSSNWIASRTACAFGSDVMSTVMSVIFIRSSLACENVFDLLFDAAQRRLGGLLTAPDVVEHRPVDGSGAFDVAAEVLVHRVVE